MDKTSFNKIIDLIKKTGDKLIILNDSEPSYVIMPIKDYENLIFTQANISGLTEEELLDKINREIAIWKSNQEEEVLNKFDIYNSLENKETPKPEKPEEGIEEKYYIEPL